MANYPTISAQPRTEFGKGFARRCVLLARFLVLSTAPILKHHFTSP